MNINLLLNIGHDLIHLIDEIVTVLEQTRDENPELRIFLSPVIFILGIFRLLVEGPSDSARYYYQTGFAQNVDFVVTTVLGCAPSSVYCFNKTGFFIYAVDFYTIM